jgi:cytochrome P450
MQAFLYEAMKDRARAPANDLISELVQHSTTDDDGTEGLSEYEILSMLAQLLAAGNETTTQLLGNAMALFASNPDFQGRMREEPSLIPAAVEEALRVTSPVLGLFRTVHTDTKLGGVDIPAGSVVAVMFGSANHDAEEFAEPDAFQVDRRNAQQHVAFGRGIHFCVGAPLARAEARIAFARLFARLDDIRIRSDAQPRDGEPSFMLRTLVELPLSFSKRVGSA